MSAVQRHLVPSWGTQRRLQALMAIGWEVAELERRAGAPGLVRRSRRRKHVEAVTAERVARLYDELWNETPPDTYGSRRARLRAQRAGWPRPMEWDEDWLDLSPEELAEVLAAEVARMGSAELRACNRARWEQGCRSPLTVAASRECMRRQVARRRANERRRYHEARERERQAKAAERSRESLGQAA